MLKKKYSFILHLRDTSYTINNCYILTISSDGKVQSIHFGTKNRINDRIVI